jgi:hypothetical protein
LVAETLKFCLLPCSRNLAQICWLSEYILFHFKKIFLLLSFRATRGPFLTLSNMDNIKIVIVNLFI